MNNTLNNLILGNWGGIILKAEIEEKIEDIELALKYTCHGDEYLLIKSNGKFYEYGWWLNRCGWPEYDELDKPWNTNLFIRRPKIYFDFDKRCSLSNEIYFKKEYYIMDQYSRVKRKVSKSMAQIDFDIYVNFMNDVMNLGITYHNDDDKQILRNYLEVNDIATKKNLDKLDEIKWSSRIDGVDGIAGKMEYKSDHIYGDTIDFIFYKGKPMTYKQTKRRYSYDRFGFKTFRLSLNQFK